MFLFSNITSFTNDEKNMRLTATLQSIGMQEVPVMVMLFF